jgi:hypothetical protein
MLVKQKRAGQWRQIQLSDVGSKIHFYGAVFKDTMCYVKNKNRKDYVKWEYEISEQSMG